MATTMNQKKTEREKILEQIKRNNPEIDNLYLDMNGIIHPCSHPQNGPKPQSENEIYENIFKYTDKIVNLVKP